MSDSLVFGVVAMLCLVAIFAIYHNRWVRIRAHKTEIEVGSSASPDDRHHENNPGRDREP